MREIRYGLLALLCGLVESAAAQLVVQPIELISQAMPGETAAFASAAPHTEGEKAPLVSAQGRFIAFENRSPNLLADLIDFNPGRDLFVHDRDSGQTQCVTRAAATAFAAVGTHTLVDLSDDGRWLLHHSDAATLTPTLLTEPKNNIYLYDRQTGQNTLVTAGVSGPPGGDDHSQGIALSPDGRYAFFRSAASDLLPGQANLPFPRSGLYVYDRVLAQTRLLLDQPDAPGVPIQVHEAVFSANGLWAVLATNDIFLLFPGVSPRATQDLVLLSVQSGAVSLLTASVAQPGQGANSSSTPVAVSDDGRRSTFTSFATDIVPLQGPPSGSAQVYTHDRQSGTNALVTRLPGTLQPLVPASQVYGVSTDGRWIGIRTEAHNYGPGIQDLNAGPDLFLYDVEAGQTLVVSRDYQGQETVGASVGLLNADASAVYFHAPAHRAVAGEPIEAGQPLLRYDRFSGVTTVLDAERGTARTTLASSADGSIFVQSMASERRLRGLTDHNVAPDLLLSRPAGAELTLLTRARGDRAVAGSDQSYLHAISANGRRVLFGSRAQNLVPGISGNAFEVYSFDRQTRTTRLLTTASADGTGPGLQGISVALDGSGRYALFQSAAMGVVSGQGSASGSHVFLHDHEGGGTRLVSHVPGATVPALGPSAASDLSRDGRRVLWTSRLSAVVGMGANQATKVYLYDTQADASVLVSHTAASPLMPLTVDSEGAALSGDGRWVVFTTSANDVVSVPAIVPGTLNAYLFDAATGSSQLINRSTSSAQGGNAGAEAQAFTSTDGRWTVYGSRSTDLVPGFVDMNGADFPDAYLFDRLSGSQMLVSHAAAGTQIGAGPGQPILLRGLSADGRWVVFQSGATNLLADGTGGDLGMYLFDRENGQVRRINGAQSPGFVGGLLRGISDDGSRVLFQQPFFNILVVWDRVRDELTEVSPRGADSFSALLSGDGSAVAFHSELVGFDPGIADGGRSDVFVAPIVDSATLPLFRDGFED